MKFKSVFFVMFSMLIFSCSSSDDNKPTPPPKKVTIEFKVKEKQLLVNESFDLLNELILENADVKTIVWSGHNDKVVGLTGTTIKAIAKGETAITASIKNSDKKATLKIVVSDVKVGFKQEKAEVSKSKTLDLNELLVLENVTKDELIWATDNSSIITVDKGVITGVDKGEANVTVTAKNKQVQAVIKITVKGLELTELTILGGEEAELILGRKKQLTVKAFPKDADISGLVWTSSNDKVLKVSNTGEIEAIGLSDEVDVIVTAPNGVKTFTRFYVIGEDITTISIFPRELDVVYGSVFELGLSTRPEPVNIEPGMLVFTSSDPSIAKVDTRGEITTFTNKKGKVTITVASKKDPSINATATVNVIAPFDKISVSTKVGALSITNGAVYGDAEVEIKENSIIGGFFNNNPNWFQITSFKVYSKDGKVVYTEDTLQDTRYGDSRKYGFRLERVVEPYIEYTLKFKSVTETRKETLVLQKK